MMPIPYPLSLYLSLGPGQEMDGPLSLPSFFRKPRTTGGCRGLLSKVRDPLDSLYSVFQAVSKPPGHMHLEGCDRNSQIELRSFDGFLRPLSVPLLLAGRTRGQETEVDRTLNHTDHRREDPLIGVGVGTLPLEGMDPF